MTDAEINSLKAQGAAARDAGQGAYTCTLSGDARAVWVLGWAERNSERQIAAASAHA